MKRIRKNPAHATASPIEAFEASFEVIRDGSDDPEELARASELAAESDPEFWAPKCPAAKLARKKAKTLSAGMARRVFGGRPPMAVGGPSGGECRVCLFRAGEATSHRFCHECGQATGGGAGAVPGGKPRKRRAERAPSMQLDLPRTSRAEAVTLEQICREYAESLGLSPDDELAAAMRRVGR